VNPPSSRHYDFGLVLSERGKLDEVPQALSDLGKEYKGSLVGTELFGHPRKTESLILLRFLFTAYSSALRARLQFATTQLQGQLLEPQRLPPSDQGEFYSSFLPSFPLHIEVRKDLTEAGRLFREKMRDPETSSVLPLFTVPQTADDLWTSFARLLVDGGLLVPTNAVPKTGAEVRIQLAAPKSSPPELSGQVIRREGQGFFAAVAASSSFKEFFSRHANVKRVGRRVRRQGGKRAAERFVAHFDVKFRNFHELPVAEVRNVSLGGIFVKTFCAPPLRSKVKLRIDLPDGDVEIDGQVVHVIGARQAMGQAYSPGVNIAFAEGPSKAHKRIADLISGYERMWPRVLLGGGSADFAKELTAELNAGSIELFWAQNAAETRERLIRALFDYDMILFDSGLGGFDVRSLLDRAAGLGSELELRTATLLATVRSSISEPHLHQGELILSKESVSRLGTEIKKLVRNRAG